MERGELRWGRECGKGRVEMAEGVGKEKRGGVRKGWVGEELEWGGVRTGDLGKGMGKE